MWYEFPRALDADSASLRHDDDYLFAGAPNVDDSFVKARGIAIQRTTTLFAIRKGGERVGSWKRWKPLGKKRTSENWEKKTECGGCGGATAIARTHERKATRWNSQVIHSACQRGFPCGKRYRRGTEEKEKPGLEEENGGKDESVREGRTASNGGNGGRARPYGTARHRTRGFSRRGRSGARKTVSRAQIVSSFPKEKYTVHSKTSWHMVTARALVVHASVCAMKRRCYYVKQKSALLRQWGKLRSKEEISFFQLKFKMNIELIQSEEKTS